MANIATVDIETELIEGLELPKNIWVCVVKPLNEDPYIFRHLHLPENQEAFLDTIKQFDLLVGHNFLHFDLPVLQKVIPEFNHTYKNVIDTLVISRFISFKMFDGKGHGLDAWGERLGYPKDNFNDFSCWSQELEDRCVIDTELNEKLYLFLEDILREEDKEAVNLEHFIQHIAFVMEETGFPLRMDRVKRLHQAVCYRLERLREAMQRAFPPTMVEIKTWTPRLTKAGTLHRGDFRWLPPGVDISFFKPGKEYSLYRFEPFNPGSNKQCIDRIGEYWRPTEKTDGHIDFLRTGWRDISRIGRAEYDAKKDRFERYGWKLNENNLATLTDDAPEGAKKLALYSLLDSRRSTFEEWFDAYNPNDGKLHGRFNGIGAWTQRLSHYRPNQGNIPRLDAPLGYLMRSSFIPNGDNVLVGCDADGIQLRVLAHYINDPELTQATVYGDKNNGTDAHSLNAEALGFGWNERYHIKRKEISGRDIAKTWIYAWLLGAAHGKQGEIMGVTTKEAAARERNLIIRYPGLQELKDNVIPAEAARGYFVGFDGRRVPVNEERLVLAGYLQNGESLIMKYATFLWWHELKDRGIPFELHNWIHDEWQTGTPFQYARTVGEAQCNALTQAGEHFNLHCPIHGGYDLGFHWAQTH